MENTRSQSISPPSKPHAPVIDSPTILNNLGSMSESSGDDKEDVSIVSSIAQLTQQILALDSASGDNYASWHVNDSDNNEQSQRMFEEYVKFKQLTKKLLESLFSKLEGNAIYERSLETTVDTLHKEVKSKELKLSKLTNYIESFIEKCASDADARCNAMTEELQLLKKEKLSLERTALKLVSENGRLKDEINLLRLSDKSVGKVSVSQAQQDITNENGILREKVVKLEEDLINLKLQREAEMVSVMSVIREFEGIIRGASSETP